MYYLIRGLFVIAGFIVFLVIILRSNVRKKGLFIVIGVFASCSLYVALKGIRFESQFMRFETPEEACEYFYPSQTIRRLIIGDKSAYVEVDDDCILLRVNDQWKYVDPLIGRRVALMRGGISDDIIAVSIIESKFTDEYYICGSFKTETELIETFITDTYGSVFSIEPWKTQENWYDYYAYLGKLENGYRIQVGNSKYEYNNRRFAEISE